MRSEHNLVLTGFMGTGKTTVGRELALKLGREFVDTDDLIEARYGPISRIFEERGEEGFRSIERAVAAELGDRMGLVIATGGRTILDPESFEALSKNGRIFCLVATPDEIYHRVTNDRSGRHRPLLQVDDPRSRIVELLTEREGEYSRFPQFATDHLGSDAVVDEIAELWASHSPDRQD